MPATNPHYGRDWAGRLMRCSLDPDHRGRCIAAHGGTLTIDTPRPQWVRRAEAGTLPAKELRP